MDNEKATKTEVSKRVKDYGRVVYFSGQDEIDKIKSHAEEETPRMGLSPFMLKCAHFYIEKKLESQRRKETRLAA